MNEVFSKNDDIRGLTSDELKHLIIEKAGKKIDEIEKKEVKSKEHSPL